LPQSGSEYVPDNFTGLCDGARVRRIRFHDLRHSAAALLLAQDVPPKAIQELLRQSSIQISMDVYGHLFDSARQERADKIDEILGVENPPETPPIVVETVVNLGWVG
jgi:integrase